MTYSGGSSGGNGCTQIVSDKRNYFGRLLLSAQLHWDRRLGPREFGAGGADLIGSRIDETGRSSANVIRFWAAEDGVSVVEFAFVAAFLMIPLVIGAADFGTALFQWMQVGNAARAGAEYATYFGSFNQASIVTAVTNATSLSSI